MPPTVDSGQCLDAQPYGGAMEEEESPVSHPINLGKIMGQRRRRTPPPRWVWPVVIGSTLAIIVFACVIVAVMVDDPDGTGGLGSRTSGTEPPPSPTTTVDDEVGRRACTAIADGGPDGLLGVAWRNDRQALSDVEWATWGNDMLAVGRDAQRSTTADIAEAGRRVVHEMSGGSFDPAALITVGHELIDACRSVGYVTEAEMRTAIDEPKPDHPVYGAGVWAVGTEIKPGTYVTIADGHCYWARLSGFSSDFDDLLTNENLNAGARGRVTVRDSDAGIEFTGSCEWMRAKHAPELGVQDPVGDGTWVVGAEVEPGTYATTAGDHCYWARLSGFSGDFDDLITNDNLDAGAHGRIEIMASDEGIMFSGGCEWVRQ